MRLTVDVIKEYQQRKTKLKTIGEFKALGRELRDEYYLTDKEAIDILNNKDVIKVLSSYNERIREKNYDFDMLNNFYMENGADE